MILTGLLTTLVVVALTMDIIVMSMVLYSRLAKHEDENEKK